jgi:methionyl-tRNA formyltransferase
LRLLNFNVRIFKGIHQSILIEKEYVKINPMSYRIVFMGSPDFACTILRALAAKYKVSGVFTQPDRESGRGKVFTPPPVKLVAEVLGIPVFQPARLKNPESLAALESLKPDVIVVAAYGQILRQNVLDLPKFGCVNVHASYLPRWRGAAPIQAAILAADAFTGVTIMKMDAGIDTGAILAQEKVAIDSKDTALSLDAKLALAGSTLLMKTLPDYLSGLIVPQPQNEKGSTYAGMLTKQAGSLDLFRPAVELERMVRAYDDWPGTFMVLNDTMLKIRRVEIDLNFQLAPGERSVKGGFPAVGTPEGSLILLEVQPAGKKWMSGVEFIRGYQKTWIAQ